MKKRKKHYLLKAIGYFFTLSIVSTLVLYVYGRMFEKYGRPFEAHYIGEKKFTKYSKLKGKEVTTYKYEFVTTTGNTFYYDTTVFDSKPYIGKKYEGIVWLNHYVIDRL